MEYRGEILIYQGEGHQTQVEVRLQGDTIWVTQKSIAALFGTQRPAITKHLSNIFKNKELIESSVCSVLEHAANDGKLYATKYYNLDAIISIGYRINSAKATKFRQWATQRLKDHLVKGYTINRKRLEQLQQTIQLIEKSGQVENLSLSEARGLLEIITNYTQSFILLNRFDSQTLNADSLFRWRVPRIVPETGDDSGHCGGEIGEVILKVSLDENSVCRKLRHTAEDGKTYVTRYY